jgi:chlorophyllide a reductase subunit Y
VVQYAKEACIPSLYFTNLISARPLMGIAGAGSLIEVVNAAMSNQHRFHQMKEFFGSVGQGDSSGVWSDKPKEHPEFRAENRRQMEKKNKQRKAQEMG